MAVSEERWARLVLARAMRTRADVSQAETLSRVWTVCPRNMASEAQMRQENERTRRAKVRAARKCCGFLFLK